MFKKQLRAFIINGSIINLGLYTLSVGLCLFFLRFFNVLVKLAKNLPVGYVHKINGVNMHNTFHQHGFSLLSYMSFLDSMKFSLKVSLKYFNEIFMRQSFMKFSISIHVAVLFWESHRGRP